MSVTLSYLKTYARFPFALRGFLKEPLTLEQARRQTLERMAHRTENFLRVLERAVYGYPRSPYLPLLKLAGCEFGDLAALVNQRGIEGALRDLREAGVFFSFEEFKGRAPVVRRGQTLEIQPKDFDNPLARYSLAAESGGTTGSPTRVSQDLNQIAARAPRHLITDSAHGTLGVPTIVWRGILPDSTLNSLLQSALTRHLPARWFSNLGLRDSKHWIKYGLATYYVLFWMRLAGARVPLPEFVPLDNAIYVARTLAELVRTHGRARLSAVASRALRVCLAAEQAGISLKDVAVYCGGEPITRAKVQAIQRVGAHHFTNYALAEAGSLAAACASPSDDDDVHLFKDAYALITYPHRIEGFDVTVPAFNLTTLSATAPKVLINLQMDDYGIVEERACSCEFEAYGFTTHLRQIRSYRKLTGEGVTLVGSEMLNILEHVLPARFGGTALDYQIQEKEDEKGFTRLALAIHPRIAIQDEQAVIDVMLDALRQSSAMGDSARAVWQRANSIAIKRTAPVWTARGKLMPLHLDHKTKS